jgi:hypothetical protein
MINKSELTEQEIQDNFSEFIALIEKNFAGERKEKLLHMYSENELGTEAAVAPASMMEHWHNAYPGGYLQHIMNVVKNSFGSKKLWQFAGANIDFTDEEMIFSALHHDLGKLGDDTGTYYKPQDQAWLQKKGEIYRMNPDIQYLEVTDRAVYNLQRYGIKYNWKEYLGLKLADGMYNEATEKYLKSFRPEFRLKTNLPHIIHMADFISCRSEHDAWAFPKPVVAQE